MEAVIGQSMIAGGETATPPFSAALTLKGCSSPQEPRPPRGDIGCTNADGLTSPLARQASSTWPRHAARGSEEGLDAQAATPETIAMLAMRYATLTPMAARMREGREQSFNNRMERTARGASGQQQQKAHGNERRGQDEVEIDPSAP